MKYRYTVFGMYGLLGFLIVYSTNCQAPLLPQQVTQIAQQFFSPYCYVKSYNIEPEEPGYPYIPIHTSLTPVTASGSVTGASGTSLSTIPFGTISPKV